MTDDRAPDIRLSDAERDQVIAQLSAAMGEGRLDVPEFEERSKWVYAAKVRGDLDGVFAGLPVAAVPETLPAQPLTRSNARHSWFFSLLGDRTHRGNLDMGRKSTSISLLGDTIFDLTDVVARDVDLQVFSLLGDVTVIVPPGSQVDTSVFLLLGELDQDTPVSAESDAMQIRLQIVSLMGNVKIRIGDR